jgi:hypothetical protein
MGSLIEELRRREAAARAGADRLRSQMDELAQSEWPGPTVIRSRGTA